MPDVPMIVEGIRACFVPRVPFGLVYGGGEVQAECTMDSLNAMGHKAFWLDLTDRMLLERTSSTSLAPTSSLPSGYTWQFRIGLS
jgi:hypothetical protein